MRKAFVKLASITVALSTAGALLMTAHSPITSAHPAKASLPTLRMDYGVGETGWWSTLDPANVADTSSSDVLEMMYAGLLRINPNGKAVPDLASHYSISKNHKVYTFYLRPGLKFSNGDPITATDVKFTLYHGAAKDTNPQEFDTYDNLIKGVHEYATGKSSTIPGFKIINKTTVQFSLTKAAAYFLVAFGYPTMSILDHKTLANHATSGDGSYLTQTCSAIVASGQFKPVCKSSATDLTSFYPSGHSPEINMVPNSHYWGAKAKFKVNIPIIASADTAFATYKQGGIDTDPIPANDIPTYHGKDLIKFPSSVVTYYNANTTEAPFNNVHCRLAVAYAIDRQTIAHKILHDTTRTIYDIVPRGMLGYYDGSKKGPLQNPVYNPSKARSELAKCPSGIHNVDMPYPQRSDSARAVVAALSSMFSAVGIGINIKDVPTQEWLHDINTPMDQTHVKIVRQGWQQDYNDPQDYCTLLVRYGGLYAINGWNNSTYNKLVDKADVTLPPRSAKRAALYMQAQHIALSQGAWISGFNAINFVLTKAKVHGLVYTTSYADPYPKDGLWANVTIH